MNTTFTKILVAARIAACNQYDDSTSVSMAAYFKFKAIMSRTDCVRHLCGETNA